MAPPLVLRLPTAPAHPRPSTTSMSPVGLRRSCSIRGSLFKLGYPHVMGRQSRERTVLHSLTSDATCANWRPAYPHALT